VGLASYLTIALALPANLGAQGGDMSGRELFVAACANCHGTSGEGATQSQVGFTDPIPDFNDCSYASREAAKDWFTVVHQGGPSRGFSRRMPAFGKALTAEQIERVVAYVRSICQDRSWPRGELNLPRPIATEKAYPEDELVITSSAVTRRGQRTSTLTAIFEKRFGVRNQYEVVIPIGRREVGDDTRTRWSGAQLGDMKLAVKRAIVHDSQATRILTLGSELLLPTGRVASGFGNGTFVYEPFVLGAHTIGDNGFIQFELGSEIPFDRSRTPGEAFARSALGYSWQPSGHGRTWSPMLEATLARPFRRSARAEWDLFPQMQVSLNTRQHIQLNMGVRLPVTQRAGRNRELVAYLLWDWFDGGLRDGW